MKNSQRISAKHICQSKDDIIEGLLNLLEYSGILFDDNKDVGDYADGCPDPWLSLSNNLRRLVISLHKLHKLDLTESKDVVAEDTYSFDARNDLLLSIECMMQEIRVNIESISTMLPKNVSVQLDTCRRLESISRRNPGLSFSTRLLPMAKALGGAIYRQKLSWMHSLQLIEDSFAQIYTATENRTEVTDNLELVYTRINRRCINSPSLLTEAMELLECITASDLQFDDTKRITARTAGHKDSQDYVNLPPVKSCCLTRELQRFDNVACVSLQLEHIVKDFFGENSERNNGHSRASSILVFGPQGSGKTHLLDEIEKKFLVTGTDIIHPVLPFDVIESTVGAAEDNLISMICHAKTRERNCVLILDDIDSICGNTEQHSTVNQDSSIGHREPHSTARLRYLFFSLLDIIQERNFEGRNGQIILICSSKENFGKDIDRFDKILPLLPPNKEERRQIISNIFGVNSSIDTLVDYTLGLSRAELAHYCRQALLELHSRKRENIGNNDFVTYLKRALQSSTPESLRSGVNADFVDMRVYSARDLQKLYPIRNTENPAADLPLFGENARASWEELMRLIVLPVCQGSKIDKILYHRGGSSSNRTFVGGVLLAAAPGTGKSTLAYFCAAVASSMNHSIKLVDVSCTSLIHKEVGGSERALRGLFQSIRSATPCIVVMDGIENIAAVRGNDNTTEGTMDRVLSTLLTELDGVESETSSDNNVGSMAIIGITHNPLWIDPALRRPGRLERTIRLDNPDLGGRERIIMRELGDTAYRPDGYPELETIIDLAVQVALLTDGYTGAELISICNDSKISALNNSLIDGDQRRDFITPKLVFDAVKAKPFNTLK